MLGCYDKNTFYLDLDPMTFILELDVDIVKMSLYTKMNFLALVVQKS